MVMQTILLIILLSCCSISEISSFNLTLLHTNDFHSRFAQINAWSSPCDANSVNAGNCFGGVARIVEKVQQTINESTSKVLFLNAGDNYQGTVWYTLYKWQVVSKFVKMMKFDAMALGNHEFDDGIDGLAPFFDQLPTLPVLCCNIDVTNEPKLKNKIKKSTIFEIENNKIGVIGYITPETKFLSQPGNTVIFTDEIDCILEEVANLKRQGIKILIALGHSGYVKDIEIATRIPDLDLVVGGHSHSLLHTGPKPSVEDIIDSYPVVINNGSHKTLVLQAFAFGKYLGKLDLEFDQMGDIVRYDGNTILLDRSTPEDDITAQEIQKYEIKIKEQYSTVLGNTKSFLEGDTICRMRECNLGNLVTDAIIDFYLRRAQQFNDGWTDNAIAVYVGGGIRTSIDEHNKNGTITLEDLLSILPFGNQMVVLVMSGKRLREMLEHSMTAYDTTGKNPSGRFLQVSGIRVRYNVSKPEMSRIASLSVRCAHCRVPQFGALNETAEYRVVVPKYMAEGGDDYTMLMTSDVRQINSDDLDYEILSDYIKNKSPLYHGNEDRIVLV